MGFEGIGAPPAVLAVALILFFLYFLPTFIGFSRKSRNKWAICLVNTLLGWSLIGWFASLVWALR